MPEWLRDSLKDKDEKKSNDDKNDNEKQSKDDKNDNDKNNDENDKKKENNNKDKNDANEGFPRQTIWFAAGTALFVYLVYNTLTGPNGSITWAELKKHIINKNVSFPLTN